MRTKIQQDTKKIVKGEDYIYFLADRKEEYQNETRRTQTGYSRSVLRVGTTNMGVY